MSITDSTADSPVLWGGSPTPRVLIAGAGMGGIAQAVALIEQGIETFEIFEKAPAAGGVWWRNRYPGAQVDIPSLLYSYSFHLVPWEKTHGDQEDILRYLDEVIDLYGFRDRIRFSTAIREAAWDEDAQRYDVISADGVHHEADVFISAIGTFTELNAIDLPGSDRFEGLLVHSADWDPAIDLTGKRVAVVGAGASAAQIVPALAPEVEHLISFQREPNWVSRKGWHVLTDDERTRLASMEERRKERARILTMIDETLSTGADPDGPAAQAFVDRNLAYLREVFADRPDLLEALTPAHPPRCKRNVLSDTFLQAFLLPNVELVRRGVSGFTETTVMDATGQEHEVDAVVMATGFQTTNYLASIDLLGRGGVRIHELWGDEPEAYLGMSVPGFPNFFMLYGPNTHGTVVSVIHEAQAAAIAKDIRRLTDERATSIEVRREAFEAFQRDLQAGIAQVVAWQGNCHNYYLTTSGKNVVQWPWSHARYAELSSVQRESASALTFAEVAVS